MPAATQPVFFYDLGSPSCYLLAETITAELGVVPEWEPVLGDAFAAEPGLDRTAIEELAVEHHLQPMRWPARWPLDDGLAARAATYAKQIGRVVAFSLACLRQTFAAGRDPADADTVLLAAAACEMHPSAVLRAVELRSVAAALQRANDRARALGVVTLPAVQVADHVFEGLEAGQRAGSLLGALR